MFLLIFFILSDLYIKNSPKSKLNLVPINFKIKKKDGLYELIIDLKITNKSETKETMVSNINFELDFFKVKVTNIPKILIIKKIFIYMKIIKLRI